MSIHCVKLPNEDESESSEDATPAVPVRHSIPKRNEEAAFDEFEVPEEESHVPAMEVNCSTLGLPPLSFDSHPFLSPIESIVCKIKRHRIWFRGMKGTEFSLSINGVIVLVAKNQKTASNSSWFISQSVDFSKDAPDLVGLLTKDSAGYCIWSSRERQSDGYRQALAGICGNEVILGKDIWIKPGKGTIFSARLTEDEDKFLHLKPFPAQYTIKSKKNASFGAQQSDTPCFITDKQHDRTVTLTAKAPLNLVQAFGIAISLFIQ